MYKRLFFGLLTLLPLSVIAREKEVIKTVDSMFNVLQSSPFVSYSYKMKTLIPKKDSSLLTGRIYINKKDSLVLQENNQQTILVTRNYYLMKNEVNHEILLVNLKEGSLQKKKMYCYQFFNTSMLDEFRNTCLNANNLKKIEKKGVNTLVEYTITDSLSFNSSLKIEINNVNFLPVDILYEVVRHADLKASSPATDYKQIFHCFQYICNRDTKTEKYMQKQYELLSSEQKNKSYKIIRK